MKYLGILFGAILLLFAAHSFAPERAFGLGGGGGSGGGVSGATTGTPPLSVSGSTVSLATPLTVQYGGTQCGSPVVYASLPGSSTNGEVCNVTDANSCVTGTAVTSGGGSTKCQVTYNGTSWFPAGGATSPTSSAFTIAGTGLTSSSTTVSLISPVTVAHGGTNGTVANATTANNIGAAALGANSDITSLTGLTTPLSVAQGGNGTGVPAITAGTGIGVSGSWPAQAVALSTPVATTSGGTGCGGATIFASLPGSPATGAICTITDSNSGCTQGTQVTAGGGSTKCQVWYNGTGWFPSGGATAAMSGGFTVAGTGLTSSGATVSLVAPVTVALGGTQCGAPVVYASLPGSPTNGEVCNVTDSSVGCVAGTAVNAGGGSTKCQVTYNGANWMPAGGATSAATGGLTSAGTGLTAVGSTVSLTNPVTVALGGTQCGAPVVYASLPGSPTNGEICNVTDALACSPGIAVGVGGGSVKCQITYNGSGWFPSGGSTQHKQPVRFGFQFEGSVAAGATVPSFPCLDSTVLPVNLAGSWPNANSFATCLLNPNETDVYAIGIAGTGSSASCGAPVVYSSLPGSPTVGETCTVTDAKTCALATALTVGGGSVSCPVIYNGSAWIPSGTVGSMSLTNNCVASFNTAPPPIIIASTQNSNGAASINVPTNANGDLLLWFVNTSQSGTAACAAGWNQVAQVSSPRDGNQQGFVCSRIASSEPGSYSFIGGTYTAQVMIDTRGGGSSTTPDGVGSAVSGSSTVTAVFGPATSGFSTAQDLVFTAIGYGAYASGNTATITPPSTPTVVQAITDNQNTGTTLGLWVGQSTPGQSSIVQQNGVISTAAVFSGFTIALAPQSSAGVANTCAALSAVTFGPAPVGTTGSNNLSVGLAGQTL